MKKIDLKKEYAHLYKASAKKPSLVEVPAMNFLGIDGQGSPEAPPFQEALGALYGLAYTMKFTFKMKKGVDYPVMALEGLWWADDVGVFQRGEKEKWQWRLLIMQPDVVTPAAVEEAREELRRRRNPPGLDHVCLERFEEGLAAQVLHVGPYSQVPPMIERLHAFVREEGYELAGKHHEIYMNDPHRTKPEKLKTILRDAVRRP